MSATAALPEEIKNLLESHQPPEVLLHNLMPLVAQTLQADRCFIHAHNPALGVGRIAFCWCKDASIPNVLQHEWTPDTATLPQEDPLFAAALRTDPSIYIEDVTTADPGVLNQDFENKTFGHRALIHAHLVLEGNLWGILQPAIFGKPRTWTNQDRAFIETLLPHVAPVVQAFVQQTVF
ncbi:GAF domain-containing protein [Rhodocytophaga aerolata]|uniref:GAF domain-containing protein n=1 Tax=Rhodocytophaga aerolata TaxID=455078 RepID=A0ABT8R3P3_9BACT|nr:GAF domain-containing protein [Rhodocytophaga aerolata]MDO1445828.1 GAF domain-containing protein [Rhodocytophaga aerolata]